MVERFKRPPKPKSKLGRPKGSTGITRVDGNSKSLRALRDWALRSGEMPHMMLLRVSRGEQIGEHTPTFIQRIDAAKACAAFFAPRLGSIVISEDERSVAKAQQMVLDAATLSKLDADELNQFTRLFCKLTGAGDNGSSANRIVEETTKAYTRTLDLEAERVAT